MDAEDQPQVFGGKQDHPRELGGAPAAPAGGKRRVYQEECSRQGGFQTFNPDCSSGQIHRGC